MAVSIVIYDYLQRRLEWIEFEGRGGKHDAELALPTDYYFSNPSHPLVHDKVLKFFIREQTNRYLLF